MTAGSKMKLPVIAIQIKAVDVSNPASIMQRLQSFHSYADVSSALESVKAFVGGLVNRQH